MLIITHFFVYSRPCKSQMQVVSNPYRTNHLGQYLTSEKSVQNPCIAYIYGYQGSERDDEVKGEGNSYTTEFRQLDPRLGRWLSLDPVTHCWQSPYNSMDNNPVWHTDKLGSTIDPSSQETFDKHVQTTTERLADLTKERDKILKKGKTSHPMMNYLNESISQLTSALSELEEMKETKELTFKIILTTDSDPELVKYNANGITTREGDVVTTRVTSTWNMGHELKHAFQHLKGDLDAWGITQDYMDEIEGFKRGFAYDPMSAPDATGYSYFNQALIEKHYPPGTDYAVSTTILKVTDMASVVLMNTGKAYNSKVLSPYLATEIAKKKQELISSGMDPTAAEKQASAMSFQEFMSRLPSGK